MWPGKGKSGAPSLSCCPRDPTPEADDDEDKDHLDVKVLVLNITNHTRPIWAAQSHITDDIEVKRQMHAFETHMVPVKTQTCHSKVGTT